MQDKICINCYVSGKVQGVFFRASTQGRAIELGITGWARNLPDGRVEVYACGEREPIQAFLKWLHQGPERAVVTEVSHKEVEWQDFERFAIK